MRDELRQDGGGDFFPLSFHVPISIALGRAGDDHVLQRVDVLGADALGEAGLVQACWAQLEAFDGTLVSFNGRGFDLPVLELQALRHGCSAPRYFERDGLRRAAGRHCDLHDWLTNSGAARVRGGLDLVAKLVGSARQGRRIGRRRAGAVGARALAGHPSLLPRRCAADLFPLPARRAPARAAERRRAGAGRGGDAAHIEPSSRAG